MVQIEDKDRLAELVIMFHDEQRRRDGGHWKLIGSQDVALLRRSGARELPVATGDNGNAICESFIFREARFKHVYTIADKVMQTQVPSGLPC